MWVAFILTILAAMFQTNKAVSCYQCVGSFTSDCYEGVTSAMVTLSCDFLLASRGNATPTPTSERSSPDKEATVTKCITLVPTMNNESFIERGCGWIQEGGDICKFVTELQGKDIQHCSSCGTDLCNIDVPSV